MYKRRPFPRAGQTLPKNKCLRVMFALALMSAFLCAGITVWSSLHSKSVFSVTPKTNEVGPPARDRTTYPSSRVSVKISEAPPQNNHLHFSKVGPREIPPMAVPEAVAAVVQNGSSQVPKSPVLPLHDAIATDIQRQRAGWCERLMENPRGSPMQLPCARPPLNELCDDGLPAFFGQLNHDIYLWKYHWKALKRQGVYLDLAANHAMHISNTFFLDRCLQWSGICVEPHPRYFQELERFRTCSLIRNCVSDKPERVRFMLYEGLSGIDSTNKNMKEFSNYPAGAVSSMELNCTVLRNVLQQTNTTAIDYLSLDLEGHELKALQGIDWNSTRISVISLEAPPNSSVSHFLVNRGYRRHIPSADVPRQLAITGDEIYLAKGVVFGSPL